jgi:PAS domain S-box-containing protein
MSGPLNKAEIETGRKREEENLRRFATVVRDSNDAIMISDFEGRITAWNRGAELMYGYTEKDALQMTLWQITPSNKTAEKKNFIRRLVEGETITSFETQRVTKDGRILDVWMTVTKLVDDAGKPIGIASTDRDITMRKREAEEASRMVTVVRDSNDAITIQNFEGTITAWNRGAELMFGYSEQEALTMKIWQLAPPNKAAEQKDFNRRLFAGEKVTSFETQRLTKDGHVLDVWLTVTKLVDNGGIPIGIATTERNITEQKKAEKLLADSETRYRLLFESAKDGIFIVDAVTGLVVDVNPFLNDLLGYPQEQLIGKHLWEIKTFKDIMASKEYFLELQEKKCIRYEDLPIETADGHKIKVEFVSNLFLINDRKMVQCNIRDITDRKRVEEALRQSEERFRILFEQAADIILQLEITPEGIPVIREANSATFRTLGYKRDELIGQPVSFINEAETDASNVVAERRQNVLSGTGTVFEAKHRCKDGTVRDFECSATEMQIGSKTFAIVVERDITKRKQLEEQLRVAQKMEAIGSLAGGIAHDFNNLLSVILNYTEFSIEKMREGDPVRNDLLKVKNAGERAAALTHQLLAFSRRQVLQPVVLDLNNVTTDLDKMLRRIIGENIDFVLVLAPDLGVVRADPGQIEQVLMNLVVNARDAMSKGGKLTIETSNVEIDEKYVACHMALKPGSYVQLRVTDTGMGMDKQTKARLFEPFFTTKEKGKGTGLGLSMVHGFVKQSNGDILVYSEPGQGTTFKIYLPRDISSTKATVIKPSTVPKQTTGTETVLVVEDEEELRDIVVRTLDEAGYTVLNAADGDEALKVSAGHAGDIQLLLTDVVMPRMNGWVLAQQLKKTRPALKVLYMSGYTDDVIVRHGELDPGIPFLGKPFTAENLMQKVREVLDSGITGLADKHEKKLKTDAGMMEL